VANRVTGPTSGAAGEPALILRDLRVSRATREVLRGVSLEVAPGTIAALMGTSGAGKSTILRAVAALEPFDAGFISVGGARLDAGPIPPESRLRELRARVGMVFQSHALFEHLTALENVTLAPTNVHGWSAERADARARELLDTLGVGARSGAHPRQLSGGEAQRVAIARVLALDPMVLLMDEPTSALDPARRGALAGTLRRLADDGRALVIATHDVEFARTAADRVAVLSDGRIVEEGRTADVLASPAHLATRDLLRAQSAAS
jgi:ABC-type polar amino acid transport system ATPase subunit